MAEAEAVYDGWYAATDRVDWEDFLDRLEQRTDYDLGSDLNSPLIRRIKAHVRVYRRL